MWQKAKLNKEVIIEAIKPDSSIYWLRDFIENNEIFYVKKVYESLKYSPSYFLKNPRNEDIVIMKELHINKILDKAKTTPIKTESGFK